MANPLIGALLGGIPGLVGTIIHNGVKNAQSTQPKITDELAKEILESHSPHIIGYFLATEHCDDIETEYREVAFVAAAKYLNRDEPSLSEKRYLQEIINGIAENEDDELQEDAKELLMSDASDDRLSEIALDEDEDEDVRISAIEKMTDIDLLIDVSADAEEEDVRQAAKKRIKELR